MLQPQLSAPDGASLPPGQVLRPQRAPQNLGGRMETLSVPRNWRIGQCVVIAAIVALALYYNTVGWKTPGVADPTDSRAIIDQIGFLVLAAVAWLTTPTSGVIAVTTWREALRRKWLTGMLLFSLFIICISPIFTGVSVGNENRLLQDFDIGFIIAMTLLITIFLGVALVPPEIDRRIVLTILAKPVNRLEFLLGKFLGLCLTLLMNLVLMSITFLLVYTVYQVRHEGWAGALEVISNQHAGLRFDLLNLTHALILHYGQLVVMSALAIVMSLIVSHITAVVFCFLAYFGGQMSSYWSELGSGAHTATDKSTGMSHSMQQMINLVYYMLPRLDRFDVRPKLVTDAPVTFNYIWKAWDSGLIYAGVLLIIGYLVFSDREF